MRGEWKKFMRLPHRLTFNRDVRLDEPYTGASIMSSKCTEPLKETGKEAKLVKQKLFTFAILSCTPEELKLVGAVLRKMR
jgi:hypothetical protein